ncbi:hypothetical protein PtA15_1A1027 [Puccinia triticina]|uniref:Something about silencing protein 4 domain-containing protein n=1 Tax=Puccinia triticina TaxID=208348 RepID=A0ABY7C940_9BASI|nr:uncharacterized protein PtA15_1A1027 [Puccinia triticina]WAQ81685.1 hypothetical protein PtA15_1A1027 [Puccinia triticina]WAR52573.1 hypothetical protein PtB15_1B1016 [Puccinia triticina]
MHSGSRRLTRSTYIGDTSPTNGSSRNRKRRSSSTDSENGWIPPPPLLPLGTKFLITSSHTPAQLSPPLSPSTSNDPISTQIAIAHLKCQPSHSASDQLNGSETITTPTLSASFRILSDHELAIPPSSQDQQDSSCSEFITLETKFFTQRHRQSEMIEKRSKKLEKEKLLHERFKLKNRLELLMNGSGPDWKSVRTLTLQRIKEDELRQRAAGNLPPQSDQLPRETEYDKVERMRRIMVQETEETLKRYDRLLDTRKISKPVPAVQLTQLKRYPGFTIKPEHRLSQPITNNQQSTSSSSPITLPQSPQAQSSQSIKIDEPLSRLRESLYDSLSIRRLATDDQIVNGQKRVGRSIYALGCKLPDISKIQLDYLSRLQAMASEKCPSSHSTPFDRPERVLPLHQADSTSKKNDRTEPADEEDDKDWIEFNPTVNEEKEIILHQSEFAGDSKFFELDEEVKYIEEQKWIQFQKNQPDKETMGPLSEASLRQIINGGKSIRKLIEERISSWNE